MFTSESWWIEDLRAELQRRQVRGGGSLGEGDVSRAQAGAANEAVARAETLTMPEPRGTMNGTGHCL